jgi:hypothetical protein
MVTSKTQQMARQASTKTFLKNGILFVLRGIQIEF